MAVSLRRRLTLILVGLTLATWVIAVVVTALQSQHLIFRQVDKQLHDQVNLAHQMMQLILTIPATRKYFSTRTSLKSADTQTLRLDVLGAESIGLEMNVWFSQQHFLIGDIARQFPAPVAEGAITVKLGEPGNARKYRVVYRYIEPADAWLAGGIDIEQAQSVESTTLLRVLLPLGIVLPVIAAILLLGINRGLRPLEILARQISARKPSALEMIDVADVPKEITPVVVSLNDLLQRLDRALSSEHRFTANAAHELQTPLAAIKAGVQQCQRQVKDEAIKATLDEISTRITAAADTVKQLLTLARLEPDQVIQTQRIDLNNLLTGCIADVGALAAERDISVQMPELPTTIVQGHVDWLSILLRNLLVNAFKHSPASGQVDIRLEKTTEGISLIMSNDCDRISDSEFSHLQDRFFYLENNENHGVGLGLSIVRRIAELHHARLKLSRQTDTRGFVAEVNFPLPKPGAGINC